MVIKCRSTHDKSIPTQPRSTTNRNGHLLKSSARNAKSQSAKFHPPTTLDRFACRLLLTALQWRHLLSWPRPAPHSSGSLWLTVCTFGECTLKTARCLCCSRSRDHLSSSVHQSALAFISNIRKGSRNVRFAATRSGLSCVCRLREWRVRRPTKMNERSSETSRSLVQRKLRAERSLVPFHFYRSEQLFEHCCGTW